MVCLLHSYSRTACPPARGAKDTFISKHRDSINISPCHSQGASGFTFSNNSREQNMTLDWRMHRPNGIYLKKKNENLASLGDTAYSSSSLYLNLKMTPPYNDTTASINLSFKSVKSPQVCGSTPGSLPDSICSPNDSY